MREFKAVNITSIKAASEGRVRTGVAAVFGNVDDIGDRIQPGAFKKTIMEGSKRVRHLWNHDGSLPPIASIKEMRELSRDELPREVLDKTPDATGGLLVKREYYDNDLANWVLQAIDKGDVNEMSFAFDVVKSTKTDEESETGEKREVRELLEMRLYDTSDVNWGMNSGTVAVGAKAGVPERPLGLIYSDLAALELTLKNRNLAPSEEKLLMLIEKLAFDLQVFKHEQGEEEEKAEDLTQAEPEEQAEAVDDTSLEANWLELAKAKAKSIQF